jgi:glycopeptide antibiotics resistance protein
MGKRQVHVIVVPKWVTIALLVLVTAAMAALLYALSGRAYAADLHPFREWFLGIRGPLSRDAFLAFLMPVIANILLFVPWGFLAFVAADAPSRPRKRTYVATVAGALVVSAAMLIWQQFLPTRVTTWPDAFWNAAGAFAGAALGHARKSVRVRFAF